MRAVLKRRLRRYPTADDIEAECTRIARGFPDYELLRIYFHDAPPATDTLTNPIDGSNAAVNRVFVPVIRHRPCCRRGQCVRKSRPLSALGLDRDGRRCRRSLDRCASCGRRRSPVNRVGGITPRATHSTVSSLVPSGAIRVHDDPVCSGDERSI